MNKILTFIFFCISFVLISGSETFQDDKKLYKEVLSEISLTRALLESYVPFGNEKTREARNNLTMALKNYEMLLKSDLVIYKFCGSIERVEGKHPIYRMVNIFRRDTRNPFVEITSRAMVSRMIKRSELKFRKRTEKQNWDRYHDLMDRDLVHFSFNEDSRTADLDEVIINRNIEKVKELVNEKFIAQGGVLNFGRIANISNIDRSSYLSAFINLNKIKFFRK